MNEVDQIDYMLSKMEGLLPKPAVSLRDYFAATAMQGVLARHDFQLFKNEDWMNSSTVAKNAYELADAMLAEREREA